MRVRRSKLRGRLHRRRWWCWRRWRRRPPGPWCSLAIGASPWATYVTILTGPLQDGFGVSEILLRTVPLTLVALGIAVSFRSGILNIGAEGQIQIGILGFTAVALFLPHLPAGGARSPWRWWPGRSAGRSGPASPGCSAPRWASTRS